ncbi:MBL fold metallo-hydrolase [Mucilaginibacter phyllosphaerae]|uniref:Glyoxylase-like metal-dependent hydrolase (Beta-lactamase superfamily II) n=1 Tax=Mucilaginibacter phyllosphaerae TaxID=1812349 RepID=A0A4Y8AAK9_9SPHI|nr:MBL fold metallo-hydrolase [Mucilaginibacter phyllosphaerae]MBB3969603.1 glyoxylase-like metal-dependent hydrolase (beta-lactamase superfamily II) [Mucilaginibacter phyllosphaerae]TEW64992.1 MBL fold metallo-hydrolase [Mucilaginibacter phyllosphaerae]GGH18664.1 MBL fold hydrolase [Mucilaginibacter phyllosphaerae]
MEIFALGEGSYSVDATKKFIPFNPETDSKKDRPGSLFIHVNPFLIKTADDLIVLDAGLGYKDTRDELLLHQHIRNAGFDPDDVTLVLMSHLHYDHSGGLVVEQNGKLQPSFPQATHVIQRQEFEFGLTGKSSSYHAEIFKALQANAKIDFVEGSGEYKPGISYELSGGHCRFHQVFRIEMEGQKVFFGGDELPEPEQLIRKFVAKYDYDGHRAAELRIQYGKMAAAEGYICLFYHARATALGMVKYQDDAFTVTPV